MIKLKLNDYLWLLPFVSFLLGYQLLNLIYSVDQLHTPDLLGKQLHDAIRILSDKELNARILAQKEDPDLPEGTVLSQKPLPNQKIRPHSPIFLLLSKKPPATLAPHLQGKNIKEVEQLLQQRTIRAKKHYLPSITPQNQCIGQIPQEGQAIGPHDKMTLYISAGNQVPALFPNLRNMNTKDVTEFLREHNIQPTIDHTRYVNDSHDCSHCIIVNQKPLAGSIINLNKHVNVHLKVTPK